MSYSRIAKYLSALCLAPLLLLVLVCAAVDLPVVQKQVERHIPQWTHNMLQLEGLHAVLPWQVEVAHIAVKDAQGVWGDVKGAKIRFDMLGLLHKQVHIKAITADDINILRRPLSEVSTPAPAEPSTSLPKWGVRLDQLQIQRIQLGQFLLGQAAIFKIDGHVSVKNLSELSQIDGTKHIPRVDVALDIQRQDAAAHFYINLLTHNKDMQAELHYDEDAQGFVALLAHLPALSPLNLELHVSGPYQNLNVQTAFHMGKGLDDARAALLSGAVRGMVDLPHQQLGLKLGLHSAAMRLKPDIGWEGLNVKASLQGPFLRPVGQGVLDANSLTVMGNDVGHAHIQLESEQDKTLPIAKELGAETVLLASQFEGIKLHGQPSTLLSQSPLVLNASFHPIRADHPFDVRLIYGDTQLAVTGTAGDILAGHLQINMPHLSNVAMVVGKPLEGAVQAGGEFSLPLRVKGDSTAHIESAFSLTQGPYQAVSLIGQAGKLSLNLTKHGDDRIALETLHLVGQRFILDASGKLDQQKKVDTSLRLSLKDLAGLYPALRGQAVLDAQASGMLDDLGVKAHLSGALGVKHPHVNVPVAPLDMRVAVAHLPSQPQGNIELKGVLDRSPLRLSATFEKRKDGAMSAVLKDMGWKSLKGQAALSLRAGQKIPSGKVYLTVADLGELSPLLGQAITGHVLLDAQSMAKNTATASEADKVHIFADAHMQMDRYAVDLLRVKGELSHLLDQPSMDISAQIAGLRANGITGGVNLSAKGPQTALAVQLDGAFEHVMQGTAKVSVGLLANISQQLVRLERFAASFKSDELALQGPTTLHWGKVTAIDHLKLLARPPSGKVAQLEANGTIKPQLALDAQLLHMTPALFEPFLPSVRAEGELTAGVKLRGTLAAPVGHIQLDATGLRLLSQETDFLPDGMLHMGAELNGQKADIETQLHVGQAVAFQLSGHVPFAPEKEMNLSAKGGVELSLANAILGASGMGVAGRVDMAMNIRGTVQQPLAFGQITLKDGRFDHYVHGVHLEGIEGQIHARGDDVEIEHFIAHAGQGTIGLSGHVGLLKPSMPLDMHVSMERAQPILSDLLTEVIESQLHIYGQAATRLDVEGDITVPQAAINLPSNMPASVPQLEIVSSSQFKKEPAPPSRIIGLNIAFNVPGPLFVRGHGLFAEMQGKLNISGTSASPDITGGMSLKRGSFNLAGVNLDFTHGRIDFNGAGSTHKLDPVLDFRADRNAEGTLASLLVSGYASAPKFDFVSTPSLPRDEVLSILLFGVNRAVLSPMQLASLGFAIVQIGGGSAFDPMGRVRNALGLDHLAIGGGSSVGNGEANVEAGKYVMKGVYVGAREGLSGKATQAQVKIDLTKELKFNATVGTGGQVTGFTTPENDPGSSIGLSYGIDY